ncbi:hypothetical protein O1L60_24280 [Streptomyces diastatochromogenes]|nr:hypothetical protein [Streptomyces diastatochromogenes]
MYEVTAVRRAGDPLPAPSARGGPAHPADRERRRVHPEGVVRVDAKLISAAQPSPPRPLKAGWITAAEEPLAGEDDVWPGIFLGVQGLLAAALLTVAARRRWGRRQTWVTAVPVLVALGVAVSGQLTRLLPNLL